MNIREAMMLASKPEPPPEETVDLVCHDCGGMWMSSSSGIHRLGDEYATVYNNYIGVEYIHCEWDDVKERLKEWYTCPNGCDCEMDRCDETGTLTPWQRWELARLMVEEDTLERRLLEVQKELSKYEGMV